MSTNKESRGNGRYEAVAENATLAESLYNISNVKLRPSQFDIWILEPL